MSTEENDDIFRVRDIKLDIEKLREAYEIAVEKVGFSQGIVNCISVTHCEDGTSDTRGIFWTKDESYNEIQIEKPVRESKYTKIDDVLTGTYLEEVVKKLSKHYTLGRVRLLKLDPRNSLSYHRDPELRIHIPIITNPGAMVIVENFATHMPADGSVYIMNTKKYHTAFNGGTSPRVHLVASVISTAEDDELYAVYGGD
jgi:hypothetical protein